MNNEPQREYTEGEQHQSFIGRRMDAFADRSREPGDATTWAIVLGSLICTLLVICYAVAGQPVVAFISLLLTLAWVSIVSRIGRVNVASILWGSSTNDLDKPPNHTFIFQATTLLALISLAAVVVDAIRGWNFSWYGLILLVVVSIYLVIYLQYRTRTNQ